MDRIVVQGGRPLSGTIPIAGAKNACLALMPATLLTEEPLTLTNVPRLSDIATMGRLLESLGCEVSTLRDGKVVRQIPPGWIFGGGDALLVHGSAAKIARMMSWR